MQGIMVKGNLSIINLMKFICSILVITIHTNPLSGDIGYILTDILARIAVPFFFVTSGYFLYFKSSQDNNYIKKYIKRLIILYTSWYILYFLWRIVFEFNGIGIKDIVLLIREYLFSGYYHLWYLSSLIISSIVVYFFIKRNSIKTLVIISIALFIIGVLGDTYNGIINISILNKIINFNNFIFGSTKVGICFAVPFLTIGILINRNNIDIRKTVLNKLLIISIVIFFIEGFLLEYISISSARNIYLTSSIVAPLIFIRLAKCNNEINNKTSDLLRNLSLGVYCSHAIFILIFNKINLFFNIGHINIVRFLIVCILSVSFSYFLYKNNKSILKIII